MSNVTRRTILGAAWSAPVIAVAVATPAAAASETPRSSLVFTNLTATEGKEPNALYVNTTVMNETGDATGPVQLYITCGDQVKRFSWSSIAGWGVSPHVAVDFYGLPKETNTVYFLVEAGGAQLEGRVIVEAPGWWK
ncbi:hypothetical protein [Paramicrobacterium chengjingii]|uniref:hypothetical protein n=1 Tax=Paramicrobacterium chengjingii TaxID=2769067 RepID=UPI0014229505|nr:hypothetical protein [Microbacterium chengjingii]